MTVHDHDPRFGGEHVRRCPDEDDGTVTLVGVVHGHPASKYRVRTVLETVDHDVLALELPPTAIGLFEQYADDERTPPAFGGEMSAAIQAARTDRVVGVDGPSRAFLGRLARRLASQRPPTATLRRVLSSVSAAVRRAFVCRAAASLAARTGVRAEVDAPVVHDVHWWDDPDDQAEDERTQIRQARSLMNAFEPCSASRASRFRNDTRDEHMADRLASLRREGDVVAVVGIHHLDTLEERLSAAGR